jgi:hypothetical protein
MIAVMEIAAMNVVYGQNGFRSTGWSRCAELGTGNRVSRLGYFVGFNRAGVA